MGAGSRSLSHYPQIWLGTNDDLLGSLGTHVVGPYYRGRTGCLRDTGKGAATQCRRRIGLGISCTCLPCDPEGAMGQCRTIQRETLGDRYYVARWGFTGACTLEPQCQFWLA